MATTTYTNFGGQIVSENRAGTERDYVPDPLGSTVALLDNTQAKTDTFAYWPHGETLSRTGATNTPLKYIGVWGYYTTSHGFYVRARNLSAILARWISPDPVPDPGTGSLFAYALLNPTSHMDASGLFCYEPPNPINETCERVCKELEDTLCKKSKPPAICKSIKDGGGCKKWCKKPPRFSDCERFCPKLEPEICLSCCAQFCPQKGPQPTEQERPTHARCIKACDLSGS